MTQEFSLIIDLFLGREKLPSFISFLKEHHLERLGSDLGEAYQEYLQDKLKTDFSFTTRLLGEQVLRLYSLSEAICKLVSSPFSFFLFPFSFILYPLSFLLFFLFFSFLSITCNPNTQKDDH